MDLQALNIEEAIRLLRSRRISAVELAQAHLARIEKIDPEINCFITLTADLALEQAAAADLAAREGRFLGPLHGIPLALKDLFETRGVATTAGAEFLRSWQPRTNAAVVDRLEGAGGVLLGKLNMHELAFGVTNANPHYGNCRNPWDLSLSPGGSSGGSAAALSAGLCVGSIGSDTGGSIRIPSAFCGVVGLKPTQGRVSLRGVHPLSWTLDHAGPMARCVRDAAILYGVIAGYDPADPASFQAPVPDPLADLERGVGAWRLALAVDDYFTGAERSALEAVKASAEVFESLGARVEEVRVPGGQRAHAANVTILRGDAAALHRERFLEAPDSFGADVWERLARGVELPVVEYAAARRAQVELQAEFDRFLEPFELLLLPSLPVATPPLAGADPLALAADLTRFTAPFNLTGLPALSIPCGASENGLPIGLQLVGRRRGEDRLLRAARAYERATPWHTRYPG